MRRLRLPMSRDAAGWAAARARWAGVTDVLPGRPGDSHRRQLERSKAMIQPGLTERLAELHRRDMLRHADQWRAGRPPPPPRPPQPTSPSSHVLRRAARVIARWA